MWQPPWLIFFFLTAVLHTLSYSKLILTAMFCFIFSPFLKGYWIVNTSKYNWPFLIWKKKAMILVLINLTSFKLVAGKGDKFTLNKSLKTKEKKISIQYPEIQRKPVLLCFLEDTLCPPAANLVSWRQLTTDIC